MQTIAATPTGLHLNENRVHVSVCTRHLEMTGVCGLLSSACVSAFASSHQFRLQKRSFLIEESYY